MTSKPRVVLANTFLAVAMAITDPRRVWVLLLGAALAAVAVLNGCAKSPEDRWYQARSTLNVAEKVFIAQTPRLDDEEIVDRGNLLLQAAAVLRVARGQLPGGGPAFDAALAAVEAYLESFTPQPPTPGTPSLPGATGATHGPGDRSSDP